MNIVGYVIHLRRATARRIPAEELQARCGVPCQILDASDGSLLSPADIASHYAPDLFSPRYPFELSVGEIGCFLSHRTAWKALLETDADAALILEDDMQLTAGFDDALTLAKRHVENFGFIQFQTREVTGTVLDFENDASLFQPRVTPLRTSGQLVHRKAAALLLDKTQPFDRPIDTFLQMHWHTGIRLASIAPSGLADIADTSGGSTIGGKRKLADKLSREWHRFKYRRAVEHMSGKDKTV